MEVTGASADLRDATAMVSGRAVAVQLLFDGRSTCGVLVNVEGLPLIGFTADQAKVLHQVLGSGLEHL